MLELGLILQEACGVTAGHLALAKQLCQGRSSGSGCCERMGQLTGTALARCGRHYG